jgi:hypothetical protein
MYQVFVLEASLGACIAGAKSSCAAKSSRATFRLVQQASHILCEEEGIGFIAPDL